MESESKISAGDNDASESGRAITSLVFNLLASPQSSHETDPSLTKDFEIVNV